MSRCNEYKDQVIELDFLYPSEGIHRRWDEGVTAMTTPAAQSLTSLHSPSALTFCARVLNQSVSAVLHALLA